jgi:hypothetical protein
MSDDLKERLSGSCYLAFENGTNDYSAAQEALDCIEELVKERDLWKSRYAHHNNERLETLNLNAMQASKIGSLMNTIAKLEKKISEMEKK